MIPGFCLVFLIVIFGARFCGFGVQLGVVGVRSASVGGLWFSASAVGSVGVQYLPKQRNRPRAAEAVTAKTYYPTMLICV